MAFRIFLSPPCMGGKERQYVQEAFDTNWIAPCGAHIDAFEREMASYIGVRSALALCSGTAAIHLALRWLGVREGDCVFCQDFTFIGSCDAILYEKAMPVFIDSEDESWNMSPAALEHAFAWARGRGRMPKAVVICDLYGESADWDALLPICRKYGVPVVEDAAEAVGAQYKGRKCGSFGDVGALSFNGNKIMTTSGGGMALSDDGAAVEKMRFWSAQARESSIWYEHREFGYNYALSNVCAAIGRGQLEFLPEKLRRREATHGRYEAAFEGLPVRIKRAAQKGRGNHWLNLLVIEGGGSTPAEIAAALERVQIEGRPAWKPMHMQPLFADVPFVTEREVFERGGACVGSCRSVDEDIFGRTVCLPSGDALTEAQVAEVAQAVRRCFEA